MQVFARPVITITGFLLFAFATVVEANGATLYVSQYGGTGVGAYDATTGTAINANLITGLNGPDGLALSGNTLFVANSGAGTVGEYNATTGAAINPSFIAGLNNPTGLALSGNTLFVANQTSNVSSPMFIPGTVGEYNATTGAAINSSFITGLSSPYRLTLSGNTLFVLNGDVGPHAFTIGEYNSTTGAAINSLPPLNFDPTGLALLGNTLFLTNFNAGEVDGGAVGEYNASTGAAINANFITGLTGPEGLALSGNTLFVTNTGIFPTTVPNLGTVGEYNASTGATINPNFIKGLNLPLDIAIGAPASSVPEPSMFALLGVGMALLGCRGLRRRSNEMRVFRIEL